MEHISTLPYTEEVQDSSFTSFAFTTAIICVSLISTNPATKEY